MPEEDSGAAATNYGSQVRYNYGQISNYFCHSSSSAHQCHFPDSSDEGGLSRIISEARDLHDQKLWVRAKTLFGQVLLSQDPAPTTSERFIAQYHIAREHFALAEFHEAAQLFKELTYSQEDHGISETASTTGSSPGDSRYWLARSFFFLEQYDEASNELQIFVALQEQQCQTEDGLRAVTEGKLWLGLTLERQGQYGAARTQLSEAVESRTDALGSEHLETLASRHHLANFLYARKDFLEARGHFQALLDSEEHLSGPEQDEAMKTRCMLALCLANLGLYKDAEPHLQRLHIRFTSLVTVPQTEYIDQGLVSYWLGRVTLHKKGNPRPGKEIAPLFREAFEIISTVIVEEKDESKHLQDELLECRRHHARGMIEQGHFAVAEQMFRQNIAALEKCTGVEEKLVANIYGLAYCLKCVDKRTEAVSVLEKAVNPMVTLEDCRYTGEDLASCLHLLANILMSLGRISDALPFLERVADATPAKPMMKYNETRLLFGVALFRLRQFESALPHLQGTYDSIVAHFPSLPVYNTQIWLGFVKCETGHLDDAEFHLQSAASSLLENGNVGSDVKSWNHYYMGRIAFHRNRVDEAFNHFRHAADMLRRLRGPEDINYIQSRYFQAYHFFRRGNKTSAQTVLLELLSSKVEDPAVHDIRRILAPLWLARMGSKAEEAVDYYEQCLRSLPDGTDYLPLHPNIHTAFVRYHYAGALFSQGKVRESAKMTRAILKDVERPDTTEDLSYWVLRGHWKLGEYLHNVEEFEEACEHLKAAVPVALKSGYGPDSVEVLECRALLADSLCNLERYDEAMPLLVMVDLGGTKKSLSSTFRDRQYECLIMAIGSFWAGVRAYKAENPQAADRFNEALAQLAPSRLKGDRWKHMRLDCQHYLACIQLDKKMFQDAERMSRELAKNQNESGDVEHAVDNQYLQGESLYRQFKYAAAREVFQKIVDGKREGRIKQDAVYRSHIWLSKCLRQAGRLKEAMKHATLALEVLENKFWARYELGMIQFSAAMYEEGKSTMQTCLDEATSSTKTRDCRYWLGRFCLKLGLAEEAINHLQATLASSKMEWDDRRRCQHDLGRAWFASGNYKQALEAFRTICDAYTISIHGATVSSSTVLSSHYYLGLTYFELDKFSDSRNTLDAVLANLPAAKPSQKASPVVDSVFVQYHRARCLVKQDMDSKLLAQVYIEAKAELEAIVPVLHDRHTKNGDRTVFLVKFELGCIAFQENNYDRALEFFQNVLAGHELQTATTNWASARGGSGISTALDVPQCQLYLAACLLRLHQFNDAAELFGQVHGAVMSRKEGEAPHRFALDVERCIHNALTLLEELTEGSGCVREALDTQSKEGNLTVDFKKGFEQVKLIKQAYEAKDFGEVGVVYLQVLSLLWTSALAVFRVWKAEAQAVTVAPNAALPRRQINDSHREQTNFEEHVSGLLEVASPNPERVASPVTRSPTLTPAPSKKPPPPRPKPKPAHLKGQKSTSSESVEHAEY